MNKFDKTSNDYQEGFQAGRDEARDDGWTEDTFNRYDEMCGEPTDNYDAGHRAGLAAWVTK